MQDTMTRNGDPSSMTRGLLALIGIAVLLRFAWAALVPVMPISDVLAYDTFARNLLEHGVFGWTKNEPFAFWAPGTAFFYFAVYKLAGLSYVNVIVANVLVAVGLVVCTARVADRLYGPRVALAAAAIIAVWPTLVMFTTLLASEVLFLFFVMAALDLWTLPRRGVALRGLGAGVALGAATLVRPLALLLPFVFGVSFLLYDGFTRANLRTQFMLALLSTLALFAVLAPWAWRNYQLFGELVLVSTNGGATLWMGNRPGGDGGFSDFPEAVRGLNDHQRNKILGALARQYILDDPARFVALTLRKLVLLYSNESIGVSWNTDAIVQRMGPGALLAFKRFTQITWAIILLTGVAGAFLMARRCGVRRTLLSPIVILAVYFSAVHSVIIIGDRYHLVVASQIAILGGFAVAALRYRKQPHLSPMAASAPRT